MFDKQAPAIGASVRYVISDSDYTPESANASNVNPVKGIANLRARYRHAVITETFGSEKLAPEQQSVNLTVFADGTNDGYPSGTFHRTSVRHDEKDKAPGTWHWPDGTSGADAASKEK